MHFWIAWRNVILSHLVVLVCSPPLRLMSCVNARYPYADRNSKVKPWSQDWLIAAGAYPSFCSTRRLERFLLPLDEMLVHRRSLPRNLPGFPAICRYPFIHLGGERHRESNLKVSQVRSRTWTARSGVDRTHLLNHEATAPPTDLNSSLTLFSRRLVHVIIFFK